jgi:signal transduction histidine kinase
LLVNVIKHAQANKVKVSIRRVNEHIGIDVEDDGKGFDSVQVTSRAAKDTKFGLFSIRERLEYLGGSFETISEPGRGSKITMTAPLKLTRSQS